MHIIGHLQHNKPSTLPCMAAVILKKGLLTYKQRLPHRWQPVPDMSLKQHMRPGDLGRIVTDAELAV